VTRRKGAAVSVRQIKGVWYWETMVNGQKHYGAFNGKDGTAIPKDRSEAKDMLGAIRLQLRQGTYRCDTDLANFANFVDKVYLPFARKHHAEPAHDEFRCEVLKAEFGKLRLRDVTTMRVESFINKRLRTMTVRVEKSADGRKTRPSRGAPRPSGRRSRCSPRSSTWRGRRGSSERIRATSSTRP
jgi:hypothetical protein